DRCASGRKQPARSRHAGRPPAAPGARRRAAPAAGARPPRARGRDRRTAPSPAAAPAGTTRHETPPGLHTTTGTVATFSVTARTIPIFIRAPAQVILCFYT